MMFLGGIEMEYWTGMGKDLNFVANVGNPGMYL